jgi:hypothetical protein
MGMLHIKFNNITCFQLHEGEAKITSGYAIDMGGSKPFKVEYSFYFDFD